MSCEAYFELLSARLDGELSPQEEGALEEHLASCEECRTLAAQLESLNSALTALDEPVPEGLAEGVMVQVRKEKARQRKTGRLRLGRWAAGIAACLAVCVGAWRLAPVSQPGPTPQAQTDASLSAQSTQDRARAGVPAAFSNELPEAENRGFTNEQTVHVTWGATPETPSARILGSAASLEEFAAQFTEDDLEELFAPYDAGFFAQNRLLAVVVEESSGSISHSIARLDLGEVTLLRTVPETGTDDMAAWLILARVDDGFADGETLRVVFLTLTDTEQAP